MASAAAPVVVGADQVLELLARLVDKNLAVYEEDEEGRGRYRLLETVRQYARDRLMESGEAETVRRRQRDHFLRLAEEAEGHLTGPEQARWYERLEAEHENLRLAIAWCERTPGDVQAGLRLAGALSRFWDVRGHIAEGRALVTSMLARPGAERRTGARAKALGAAAALAAEQGDFEAAGQAVRESLGIHRETGDKAGEAAVLMGMGFSQGDAGAARAYFEQSLALRRELGDVSGIAECLNHLGRFAWHQGDAAGARRLIEEALGLQRGLGNRREIALTLENLADLAVERGDYAAARPLQEEAAAIYRELGDKRRQADYLQALANQALALGEVERARAAYDEAVVLCREMDDERRLSHLTMLAGHLLLERGDFAAARARYEEGLAVRRAFRDEFNTGWALLELGHGAWCQGDWETVRGHVAEAAALFRKHGNRPGLLAALESLAGVAAGRGRAQDDPAALARAARLFAAAQGLHQSLRVPAVVFWRRSRARLLEAARGVLEGEAYARAREEGRAMSLEAALDYALEAEGERVPVRSS
jgi:tetratricopeptide (TPR) repeat protein